MPRTSRLPLVCALVTAAALGASPASGQATATHREPIFLAGVHAGMPTIASLTFGPATMVGANDMLAFQFEPGIAGGRLNLALVVPGRTFVVARASLLRTWGRPWGPSWRDRRTKTWLGPELQVVTPLAGLGVRGGVMFPLRGGGRPAPTVGVSVGF